MKYGDIEEEVIVHPVGGMQLSQGYIRGAADRRYRGGLPGIETAEGDTLEDVLQCLDYRAKAYYGDDVVVEISRRVFVA